MDRLTGNSEPVGPERGLRGLETAEILYVLFKRKWLIAGTVLLACGVAVASRTMTSSTWEASTVLVVPRGASADGAGARLPEPGFLARPAVLSQVVERLGPATVLRASMARTSSG